MIQRAITIGAVLVMCLASPAAAAQYFGVGFHAGGQYDVGMLASYNPSFQTDPQNSLLLGFALKANYSFLFLRAGIDTSFVINEGKVLENSDPNDPIEEYSISYTGIPLFVGLNFPVQDVGEFYLGGGGAYFLGRGTVKYPGKEDFEASALGYGFIAGIQLVLSPSFRLYIEWEYLDAKSEPVLNTVTAPQTWKNYYVDFTGHRFLLGLMYYVL
jgi:opacity protein-like surface antigen